MIEIPLTSLVVFDCLCERNRADVHDMDGSC